jgi:serine/threonine protein kinase
MPIPDRVRPGPGQDLSSDADSLERRTETETSDGASPPPSPDEGDFAGTSRFKVRRWLGSGGFGAVYEACDAVQQRPVALKVLKQTQPALLAQFKREVRAVVDVHHPNLVELFELFNEGSRWFFTMDLVQGVNFLQYVHVKEAIFPKLKTIVRGGTPDYMSPEQRSLRSVGAAATPAPCRPSSVPARCSFS